MIHQCNIDLGNILSLFLVILPLISKTIGKVTAIEINFRFVETGDESILLDMFSKGEEINKPVDSTDQYFFLDFTNGMHIDCNCESCIIEYEDKKVVPL